MLLLVIVGAGAVGWLLLYNGLVSKKNQVDNVEASVDTLLKKRSDLIPNLVASVQGYMVHERELLNELTALRSRAPAGGSIAERAQADREISQTLGRVMAVAESYPDLKASQNFLQLQASLNEVEEQISAARRAYNAAVTALNNALEMIPTNFIGRQMGLQRRSVFEATDVERRSVDVGQLLRR